MGTTPYPYLATFSFALLLVGFFLRHRGARRHALLMGSGMAIDLALVLVLELSKGAVATAVGPELTAAQRAHVAFSAGAVALYFPVAVLGWIRLNRPSSANVDLRTWHRRLGYAALLLRAAGFLFMFSMLGRAGN